MHWTELEIALISQFGRSEPAIVFPNGIRNARRTFRYRSRIPKKVVRRIPTWVAYHRKPHVSQRHHKFILVNIGAIHPNPQVVAKNVLTDFGQREIEVDDGMDIGKSFRGIHKMNLARQLGLLGLPIF